MTLPASSWGFGIGLSSLPTPVTEFYNVHLDHYFLAFNNNEIGDIDAGKAGPGWVRTGLAFEAFPYPPNAAGCEGDCGAPVSRFYGTPGRGPNSHFFTAFAQEAEWLKRAGSEWTFESNPFSIPLPDAAGRCAAGSEPVYRFDNGRGALNDDNHRYVADARAREKMRARGWIEEGVAFCTPRSMEVPIAVFSADHWQQNISAGDACRSAFAGACIGVHNLPLPTARLEGSTWLPAGPAFAELTGVDATRGDTFVVPGDLSDAAAQDVFLQQSNYTMGVHLDTRRHGAGALSSVSAIYRFRTEVEPGARDERFAPWSGPREDEVQLAVSFALAVKRLETRSAASHAYGHPTLEFVDRRSGKHLYFTALAYGTVGQSDLLMRDSASGNVIVGTTLRADSPYLRNFGTPSLAIGRSFVAEGSGVGGTFALRMDRAEFQHVLDAAASVEPALSRDTGDYLVASFRFKHEVSGDGEIGLNMSPPVMQLLRR